VNGLRDLRRRSNASSVHQSSLQQNEKRDYVIDPELLGK
jgi:hypothetical protein